VRKNGSGKHRRLTDDELLSHFEDSLTSLEQLNKIFDEGHPPIVFSMATEVRKIVLENSAAIKLRKMKNFPSPASEEQYGNLMAYNRLIIGQIGSDWATCVPKFLCPIGMPFKRVSYNEWWSEVIYRANAALPGTALGMIPVNDSPSVPWESRVTTNRMGVVTMLRKKLGAHIDAKDYPRLLDDLNETRNWMSFRIQDGTRMLSTDDGSLQMRIGPLPAMMRQIAEELLIAYGRQPEPITS
jgi:hypothetical protein